MAKKVTTREEKVCIVRIIRAAGREQKSYLDDHHAGKFSSAPLEPVYSGCTRHYNHPTFSKEHAQKIIAQLEAKRPASWQNRVSYMVEPVA